MRRILITVAYDGRDYNGFQIQENGDTIEGRLNLALSELTNEVIKVKGASRTDAGVSGLDNRAVFNMECKIPVENIPRAVNTFLPEDIRVLAAKEVSPDYNIRAVKTHKTYEYTIYNAEIANPLICRHAYHVPEKLDVEKMNEACKVFLGEHDFTSFCSAKTETLSNVREILLCEVIGAEPSIIKFRIKGNGFLYNMVRIIAGTLIDVGRGKLDAASLLEILEAKDRTRAKMTAPACGLTLMEIRDVELEE